MAVGRPSSNKDSPVKLSHAVSLTATFIAVGLSLQAAPAPAQAAPTRPNIVVIMTDDQDVDSLPVMRNLVARPHGSWVQFTHAYTNIAICGPSRAAFFTGQYGHNNHVVGNDGRPLDDTNTLAVWLDDVGYRTGLIGKYLNGVPVRFRAPPGWDYVYPAELGRREVDRYTDQALSFINSSADEPFFLYLGYKGPHKIAKPPVRHRAASVYVPPDRPNINEVDMSDKPLKVQRIRQVKPKVLEGWRQERVSSQRELLGIDDGIQAVIDALEDQGVLENTLIIFTADNGFSWGSHRMTGKLCPYEECSNVPLFIRYPGLNGNRVDSHLVSNVDLASTIAEYANVVPRLAQDGRSLIPLLENPQAPWEDVVLLERRGVNDFFGVRTRQWKYIEYASGEKELYDLTADPYEMQSVAGRAAYSQIQATLAQRLSLMVGTFSVTGIITDVNRNPVPGVVVSAGNGQQATTAANGKYILSGLIPGTYTLTPMLAGHSFNPPTRSVTIIDRDLAEKHFTAERVVFTISGTVTRDGLPLAGVVVSAGPGFEATTGADGTYALTQMPRGTHTLTPLLAGHVFTPPTRTVMITNINLPGRDFTAARVYSISGTITLDGQPLAGVAVADGAGHTATTNTAGEYSLAGLSPGNYSLSPTLAGYVFTPPVRSVALTNQDLVDKDFTAALITYSVSGAITHDGQPLPGVLVSDGNGHTATTNAAGAYTVPGLLPGNHTLTPMLEGYLFTPPTRAVTIVSQDLTGRNFTAALITYSASGTITRDGQPLAGVLVSDGNGHTATTNASGVYTVSGLLPGNHTLTPSRAGYTFDPPSRPVTVTNEDVDDIDFAATLLTYDISGIITLDGQPLAGVTVADGAGHSDTTAANGEYTLAGLPPDTYTLTPSLAGYVFTPPVRTVTITDNDLTGRDFTAAPAFTVSGTITLNDQPLAGVLVSDGAGHSDTTDANGEYSLVDLTAGEHSLTPSLAGYVFTPPARTVTIIDGDLTGRDFVATPVFDISGTITLNGQPLAGVLVSDGNGHSHTTNANGVYTLTGLLPGEYMLTPTLAGYTFDPSSRTVTLTDQDLTGRDFAATLITYAVSGTITLDGQPFGGVTVTDGNGHTATTDASGEYTLTGLPPGNHTLTPILAGYSFAPPSRGVTVVNNDLTGQNFAATLITYSVSGTITLNSQPLAGVTVSDGVGHTATTNASGVYTLTGLPPGSYTLTPALSGYTFTPPTRALTITTQNVTDRNFTATLITYSVSGTILVGGQPLAGVTVSDSAGHTATTDAGGDYTLTGLPPGSHTLTPSKAGYTFDPASRSVTVTNANVGAIDFTATLITYSISGTITLSGQPLAGVTVSGGAGRTATTDANGIYMLTGLPPGTYTLTPSLTGYTFTPATRSVSISSQNVTGRNFTATLITYSVSGTILVAGQPLSGVSVSDGAGHTATTNTRGVYTVTGLPPGSHTLTPSKTGYSFDPASHPVTVTNANVPNINFAATLLTYAVAGTITSNGQPLAGVTVSDGAGHTATTNANGLYTLAGLPAGNYTLTPALTGYNFNPPSLAVTVTDSDLIGRDFTASVLVYYIAGTITFNGQPLAGVVVSDGNGRTTTTNANGGYTLTGLPAGTYTLTPTLAGYTFTPSTRTVTVSSQNVGGRNFTATLSTYSVSGTILAGGLPLAGVTVADGAGHTATTDAGGVYTLTGLPPGSYTVTPAKTGYSFAPASQSITVTSGNVSGIDFTATLLTYSVAGAITLNGQPLAGVTVADGAGRTATTDANGLYSLTGLPAGSYILTPALAGHSFNPPTRSVTITNQNVTGQTFAAALITYSVSGTILAGGQPLAGVTVADGAGLTATTNASGVYTLTGLLPGNYTLTASKTGYTFDPVSQPVIVAASNVSNVNFTATLITYSVAGQITVNGDPLPGVTVSDGADHTDASHANGRYLLSGLPPGTYTITPTLAGYSFDPPSRVVTITNADTGDIDFAATQLTYSVSGTITVDGQPLAGVTVADDAGHTDTTNASGVYTLTGLLPGSYTLTPVLAGHAFTPVSRAVTVVDQNLTGQNFTASTQVYTISGSVTLNGQPLAGATVSTAGGRTATTNAGGAYTLVDLPAGTYTVTPSKSGYSFTPSTRSVTITSANVSNRDFSATLVVYSASGTILVDGAPLAGVVVADGAGHQATTNVSGNYTVTGLPPGNHTLTPVKAGYSFDPPSLSITVVSQNLTGQDFAAAVRFYTISGIITLDGQPLAGVVVADGLGGEAITDDNGYYVMVNLSPGTYTLTPSLVGYSFTPANHVLTIVDNDLSDIDFTAEEAP